MDNPGVVAYAAGDLRIEEMGHPEPAPNEAIIEIAYGGVCGSDLHYWQHGAAGASILREPMLLGHEVAGTVITRAADGSGPEAGAPVAVHPLTAAGDGVTPYPADRPNLAPASTYLGSALLLPHTQGAFARRVALPTRMLHELPAGMPLELGALAEPAAVAWHGIGRAGEVTGKTVAVIGSGPIGLLAIAVALHHGATAVTATDLHEHPRRVARGLGATALDARDADAISRLHADVVIESSGTVPGLAAAVTAAARGGTVVMLGLQRNGVVDAPLATAITRELALVGSFRFGTEFDDVITALADGSLRVDGIITDTVPAEHAEDAFRLAADASASSKVMLDFREPSA